MPWNHVDKSHRGKVTRAKLARVLNLAAKHLPTGDIARATKLKRWTVESIIKQFKGFLDELPNVKQYRQIRGDLLNASELRLLKSLTSRKAIQEASLNNRAYAFKQVHDARRLQEGLSTANIANRVQRLAPVKLDSLKVTKQKDD